MLLMVAAWVIVKPKELEKRNEREVQFVRPPQVNAHVEGETYELDLNKEE